jgi:hypothetical protein
MAHKSRQFRKATQSHTVLPIPKIPQENEPVIIQTQGLEDLLDKIFYYAGWFSVGAVFISLIVWRLKGWV